MSKKNECIGEVSYNKYGTEMRIIEYYNNKNVIVEFQDDYHFKKKCYYLDFKKGLVSNPYDLSVLGVAMIGNISIKEHEKAYIVWKGIVNRCYTTKRNLSNQSYEKCVISDDWLCFENFCKWYEQNYYEVNDEKMCVDKDILIKNNHLYSKDTCLIVPYRINMLFAKRKKCRGDFPIGVSYDEKRDMYGISRNYVVGQTHYLGRYGNPVYAFNAYKEYKEKQIKQVADEYKELIPKILYDAMYAYEVDIDD